MASISFIKSLLWLNVQSGGCYVPYENACNLTVEEMCFWEQDSCFQSIIIIQSPDSSRNLISVLMHQLHVYICTSMLLPTQACSPLTYWQPLHPPPPIPHTLLCLTSPHWVSQSYTIWQITHCRQLFHPLPNRSSILQRSSATLNGVAVLLFPK